MSGSYCDNLLLLLLYCMWRGALVSGFWLSPASYHNDDTCVHAQVAFWECIAFWEVVENEGRNQTPPSPSSTVEVSGSFCHFLDT